MARHIYIILAGVPDVVFDYVRSQPPYKLGAGDLTPSTIISRPLKRAANGIYRYADGYYTDVFTKLCIDLMPRVKANRGIEITIFLIYVAYDPTLTKEFVRKFFPLTLNYAVADLGFVGVSNRLLHQRRNMLVQHIKSAAMLLRNNVGSIKHTLNSNRSTTPFLLPIANFRSNRLVPFLERASQEIPKSHEVQQLIRTLEADFRRQQKRVTINGVTYFTDDRNLIFKAPPERLMHGQNLRHNSIHGGGGHLDRCTVASRTRLGAPYKPTLHYDCNYEDRRVSRDFSNCHNELVRARNWTHANIAPNDWVG